MYIYYADGKVKSKTDKNGSILTYIYDIHGNLLTETADGPGETKDLEYKYTYDNKGNQLTMTDTIGTTRRTYDELGRVLTKTVPSIGTVTYTYDIRSGAGEGCYREKTTDPKGNITIKEYDKTGRLIKVIAGSDTVTYTYYDNGRRKSVTYNNGTKEEYTYDVNNQIETLINRRADGSILDSYTYTYDSAGNQLTKNEIIGGVEKGITTYAYDALNRLQTVVEPSGRSTAYEYDEAGNRMKETVVTRDMVSGSNVTSVSTYTYDSRNRLTNIDTKVDNVLTKTTTYTYDSNGNQLTVAVTVGSTTTRSANTYDVHNQLVQTITEDGTTVNNTYSAEGYRTGKEVNGEKTYYLYEEDKVILEVNENGSQKAQNIYGTNLLLRVTGTGVYQYLYNGHADVIALITRDGIIAATYYYDAFGNIPESTSNIDNNILYAGYQYDEETGLYYLNARMYDPVTARFLQEDTYKGDPNDPLSLNLYTYCQNNPIMFYDPIGHDLWKLDTLVKATKGTIKIDNKKDTVTVTINGKKKVYDQDDLYYYNGSYIIDDRQFKQDLHYNIKVKIENDILDVNSKKVTSKDITKSSVYKKLDEGSQAFLRDATDRYGAVGYNYYSTSINKIYNTIEKNKNHQLSKSQEYSFGLTRDAAAFLELNYNLNRLGSSFVSMEQQFRDQQLAEGKALFSMLAFNVALNSGKLPPGPADPDFRMQNGVYVQTTYPKGYISNRGKWWTVPYQGTLKTTGKQAQIIGATREQNVANITGGEVSLQKIKSSAGGTDLDVIGPNGELIMVGGPAKAKDLGKLGQVIKIYQDEAIARGGVGVKAYFAEGTPQNVIDFAIKKLGADNVVIFK